MAKFLEVKEVCGGNNHLPVPLVMGEIVMQIEPMPDDKFVRIFHNAGKATSSFSTSYFKKYVPKDKMDLLGLIKSKGRLPA